MEEDVHASRRGALRALGVAAVTATAGCSMLGGDDDDQFDDGPFDGETIQFDGGDAGDFADAIERLADEPGGTLEIEPGTYEFDPRPTSGWTPWSHFQLTEFEDARIRGNGATIAFSDPNMQLLQFVDGGALDLRDLTLDYAVPPFSQATIRSIDRGARTLAVELEEGFPALDHAMFDEASVVRASVHEPDGAFVSGVRNPREVWKRFASMDHRGGNSWRLALDQNSTLTGLQEGRRLAVLARGPHHALVFQEVDEPTLESVTIHASPMVSIVIGHCGEPVVRDCTLAPDPDAERISAANADGIHVYNCRTGVTIEGCRIERQQDDAIAIESTMARVDRIVDDRTVELDDPSDRFVVEPGDVLAVMGALGDHKGRLPPVETGEEGSPTTPETIRFSEPPETDLLGNEYLLNTDYGNEGFEIRDTVARDCMARLIRISAGPGVVEENTLSGCSNQAVFLNADTRGFWPPIGWAEGVTVRDNEIRRAGLVGFGNEHVAAIDVAYDADRLARGRPHRDVEILDNDVSETADLGIRCTDAESVRIEGNELSELNRLDYAQVDGEVGYGMGFQNVADVTATDNVVRGSSESLSALAWLRDATDVSLSDNDLIVDGESRDPHVVED